MFRFARYDPAESAECCQVYHSRALSLLRSSFVTLLCQVLGCTAPVLAADTEAIVFVADGRFHLEAIMIANPAIPAYRWAAQWLQRICLPDSRRRCSQRAQRLRRAGG